MAAARLIGTLALVASIACGSEVPDAEPPATPEPSPSESAAPSPAPATRATHRRLIDAARRGDLAAVRRLLAAGASVRARDATGATALIAAAYGNHLQIARTLIAAGADVNTKDETQQSAYLISTSEVGDDARLLEMTLAGGADVHSLDRFDGTGLIRAADRGHVAIVRRLLATDIVVDHVNNLGWTALHEAIILGDGGRAYQRIVSLLIDAGADVNLPSARDRIRPLAHAENRGHTAIAELLRTAGARR